MYGGGSKQDVGGLEALGGLESVLLNHLRSSIILHRPPPIVLKPMTIWTNVSVGQTLAATYCHCVLGLQEWARWTPCGSLTNVPPG